MVGPPCLRRKVRVRGAVVRVDCRVSCALDGDRPMAWRQTTDLSPPGRSRRSRRLSWAGARSAGPSLFRAECPSGESAQGDEGGSPITSPIDANSPAAWSRTNSRQANRTSGFLIFEKLVTSSSACNASLGELFARSRKGSKNTLWETPRAIEIFSSATLAWSDFIPEYLPYRKSIERIHFDEY